VPRGREVRPSATKRSRLGGQAGSPQARFRTDKSGHGERHTVIMNIGKDLGQVKRSLDIHLEYVRYP
jgi:hypothetical protein